MTGFATAPRDRVARAILLISIVAVVVKGTGGSGVDAVVSVGYGRTVDRKSKMKMINDGVVLIIYPPFLEGPRAR